MRRGQVGALALALIGAVAVLGARVARTSRADGAVLEPRPHVTADSASLSCPAPTEPGAPRALVPPTGAPPSLACGDAQKIVAQARTFLASAPAAVRPAAFGDALVDWLDPHGLWSAAPDAPLVGSIRRQAADLVGELESRPGERACDVADQLGRELAAWVAELREIHARAAREAAMVSPEEGFRLAQATIFEDGPVTRPARALAAELGQRAGALEKAYGDSLHAPLGAALSRTLPDAGVDWSGIVLAASVRAYLPQIDPHGGWAPLDEETSLYEIGLEAAPPPRLWRRMVRTAIGIRVEETAAEGLLPGDVVLAVGDVATAGLSVEQVEQLAYAEPDGQMPTTRRVVVLGPRDAAPREVELIAAPDGPVAAEGGGYDGELVPYGDASVLVLPIGDVPDDLGDEVTAAIQAASASAKLGGVLLDLRGNGGGSTDGASAALGVFLPGAPLFPLRRRDGTVEVNRAPTPPPAARWTGPVAALVDGDTASAAEMIAGALAAYRRGPVVGDRTYGKGCAQEYLDDDAHAGVLRLTTLVYALPDGAPVQLAGISPTVRIPMPRAEEREAMLVHALAPWRGPDVRDPSLVRDVPWAGHGGQVGPCQDGTVCRALRAIGSPRAATARGARP